MFERWCVVYDHDGAPLDGAMFVHKHAAEQVRREQKNPNKYRVQRMVITNANASA